MPAVLPLATIIVSGVIYHLAQKVTRVPSPWRMLAFGYGAAFAVTLALALFTRHDPGLATAGRERIAGLLVGLSALGIEAGYFFLYRSGWPISSASVVAGVSGMAVLAIVGITAFGEPMSARRVCGLALAALAAILVARR